jgi:hypothetical protein
MHTIEVAYHYTEQCFSLAKNASHNEDRSTISRILHELLWKVAQLSCNFLRNLLITFQQVMQNVQYFGLEQKKYKAGTYIKNAGTYFDSYFQHNNQQRSLAILYEVFSLS